MGKILIVLLLLLYSCSEPHVVHKQEIVEYTEKYCPNCNGVGKIKMSTTSRVALGIITFGPGALCDVEECEMCRGTGIIKVRKIKNE